jgi:hypothetical protein
MNHIRHIRRIAGIVAVLATALVAFATTPAFAVKEPPPGGGPVVMPQHLAPVHTIAGGMAGWQITLIAVGAALLAATVAVHLDRARASRQKAIAATA